MTEPLNSDKRGCRECRKPELHAEDCYFVDNRGFTNRRIIVLDSERSPAFEQGEPQPCSGCGLLYKHSTTCKYGDGSYNKAAILDSERSPKPQAVERHASTELQPCRSCRETEFHKQICHLSTLGRRSRVRDEERSLPRYQPATPQPQPEATDGWVYGELADGAAQTDEPLVELESFLAEYAPQPEAALCGEHCGHNPELMYRGVCRYQESKDGDICGHRCGVEAVAIAETPMPSVIDVIMGLATGYYVRHIQPTCDQFLCLPETCKWTEDADGYWATSCGQDFVVNSDTPSSNGMLFCFHCGKHLEEVEHP